MRRRASRASRGAPFTSDVSESYLASERGGVQDGKSAAAQHTASTQRYTPWTREVIHESCHRAMDAALSGTGNDL